MPVSDCSRLKNSTGNASSVGARRSIAACTATGEVAFVGANVEPSQKARASGVGLARGLAQQVDLGVRS